MKPPKGAGAPLPSLQLCCSVANSLVEGTNPTRERLGGLGESSSPSFPPQGGAQGDAGAASPEGVTYSGPGRALDSPGGFTRQWHSEYEWVEHVPCEGRGCPTCGHAGGRFLSGGRTHRLTVEDTYTAGEWQSEPVESRRRHRPSVERPKRLGGTWYWPRAGCKSASRAARSAVPSQAVSGWEDSGAARCDSPYCDPCRVRVLEHGAKVWLVTATRAERVKTHRDLFRFAAAVKLLDVALRDAGAYGATWVYEVKVDDDTATEVECCDRGELVHPRRDPSADGVCPLCNGTGRAPGGHLHAHGIVMVPGDAFIPWAWLHRLRSCRALDPAFGRVDVQLGDRAGGIEGVWGYVGGYLQRLKEDRAAAWLRRFGGRWQTTRTTGAMRGAAHRVVLQDSYDSLTRVDGEELPVAEHMVLRKWRVRDRRHHSRSEVPASFRDAVRGLRARGYEPGHGSCPYEADRALLEALVDPSGRVVCIEPPPLVGAGFAVGERRRAGAAAG